LQINAKKLKNILIDLQPTEEIKLLKKSLTELFLGVNNSLFNILSD